MGIDTSAFKRMQFDKTCFEKFNMIIGMNELLLNNNITVIFFYLTNFSMAKKHQ